MQTLDLRNPEAVATLEQIEAEVWADIYAAAPPELAAGVGIRSLRIGGGLAGMVVATNVLAFNRAIALGILEPIAEADIDRLLAWYDGGPERWMIAWSPAAQPAHMPGLLDACGLYHHNNWAKLYRRASAPLPEAPTDLRIAPVSADARDAIAGIWSYAFDWPYALAGWIAAVLERPHWHAWAAFDGNDVAAIAAMYVRGTVAWFGFAATRPEYRARGCQAALIAVRTAAAREQGVELFVAETAEDRPGRPATSFRNMLRFGFQLAYLRPNYVMLRDGGTEKTRQG